MLRFAKISRRSNHDRGRRRRRHRRDSCCPTTSCRSRRTNNLSPAQPRYRIRSKLKRRRRRSCLRTRSIGSANGRPFETIYLFSPGGRQRRRLQPSNTIDFGDLHLSCMIKDPPPPPPPPPAALPTCCCSSQAVNCIHMESYHVCLGSNSSFVVPSKCFEISQPCLSLMKTPSASLLSLSLSLSPDCT